jgi:hypothetical protein
MHDAEPLHRRSPSLGPLLQHCSKAKQQNRHGGEKSANAPHHAVITYLALPAQLCRYPLPSPHKFILILKVAPSVRRTIAIAWAPNPSALPI